LAKEEVEVTDGIRNLKAERHAANVKAQQQRQCVPSAMITHWETTHRELAARLLAIHTEQTAINKELRANKAARKANGYDGVIGDFPDRPKPLKTEPLKKSADWLIYFRLAAQNELDAKTFARIERVAKSMAEHARINGVSD
jgi:hypothetical protein